MRLWRAQLLRHTVTGSSRFAHRILRWSPKPARDWSTVAGSPALTTRGYLFLRSSPRRAVRSGDALERP